MKKVFSKLREFCSTYSYAWIVPAYIAVYLPWFFLLERHVTRGYHVIHMAIDDYIPFCEYFIIPYYMWFFYMAVCVGLCLFTNKRTFFQCFSFLAIGMTIFLIVSTIFPNGHHLRPSTFVHENFFSNLVAGLYAIDTPTNLFPSIHVYNSIGSHLGICTNENLRKYKWLRVSSFIICVSIILSTMFLKQHSVFDVLTAFALGIIVYPLTFKFDFESFIERQKQKKERAHA